MTPCKALLLLAAFAAVLAVPCAAGEKTEHGFIHKVFKGKDGDSKYVVFVPHAYKGDKDYPLILFLHGAGETGTDGERQTKTGLGPAIRKNEKSFKFIAVFPQSEKRTWQAKSADGERAMAILEQVEKDYKVDSKRIYLTGLSMGGFGTWSLAAAYPTRWAAIAPICGGGNPKTAAKIKDIPCWCFHGGADSVVPAKRSRDMIDALKAAGGEPRYDEYAGVDHNSWDRAYRTAELYTWFLKHKTK